MQKSGSESNTAAVPTVDLLKHIAASISMESEHESNAASAPTVDVLEDHLSAYAQRLKDLILSANDARNSSDPDVLMSLSKKLEQGADELLDVARKFINARGNADILT